MIIRYWTSVISILLFSSLSWGAGFNFFDLFKNEQPNSRLTVSSKSPRTDHRYHTESSNCDHLQPWYKRANRTAGDIARVQRYIANGGSPSAPLAYSADLINKAMSQVSCPPVDIGAVDGAGVCGMNGYRDSSYDCAYYVRKALEGTILPMGVGGLGHAKDQGCYLEQYGMTNLCQTSCGAGAPTCLIDPYRTPVGAVLIYDNVPGYDCHWAGHSEIRTPDGFVSDYFSPRPRSEGRPCRRLIGVWVKGGP